MAKVDKVAKISLDSLELTAEIRGKYAELLRALTQQEGWRVFLAILAKRTESIGLAALDDKPEQLTYWQGRRDEVAEIVGEVNGLVQEAEEERVAGSEATDAFLGRRFPE